MEVEKDPCSYIWLPTTWWCKDPEHLWWYLATSRPQYPCFSSTRVNDLALIQAPWIHDAVKWAAGDAILSPKLNFDFFFLKVKKPAFHIIMQNTKTRGLMALQAPLQNTIHVTVQAPFHYPNMWLWVSNCTGGETVKQSKYNHWSMPRTASWSKDIYNTDPIPLSK